MCSAVRRHSDCASSNSVALLTTCILLFLPCFKVPSNLTHLMPPAAALLLLPQPLLPLLLQPRLAPALSPQLPGAPPHYTGLASAKGKVGHTHTT
jgi:hypothetical protein